MRKETPIRNNPGITKILKLDEQTKQWKDSGKFRAVRRVFESGSFKREQSVFDSLEEARSFRRGSVEDISERRLDSLGVSEKSLSGIKFSELVEEWKNFHYLQLEKSSQQMYETRLPNLNYLNRVGIETIDTSVIDGLVKYWVNELPRGRQRETFGKELDLLKLILNF